MRPRRGRFLGLRNRKKKPYLEEVTQQRTSKMKLTLQQIINENVHRLHQIGRTLHAYNPTTGKGCAGDRVPYQYDGKTLYLLKTQIEAPDFTPSAPNANRAKYDFEYYLNPEPNLATRQAIAQLEATRTNEDAPSRKLLILHSHDTGITQLCQTYFQWLQFIATPGTDAAYYYANAKQRNQARIEAKQTLRDFGKPKCISKHSLGFHNNREIIRFCTVRTPNANYGFTPHYQLYTNASSKNTHLANLSSTPTGLQVIVCHPQDSARLDFFTEAFLTSEKWDFNTLFLPWHTDNTKSIPLKSSISDFWATLTPYEYHLWEKCNLTLEQINWYRTATYRFWDEDDIAKIYPTTLDEATYLKIDRPETLQVPDCEIPDHNTQQLQSEAQKARNQAVALSTILYQPNYCSSVTNAVRYAGNPNKSTHTTKHTYFTTAPPGA